MMEKKILSFGFLIFYLITVLSGCKNSENSVLEYFKNAELQYENESQKNNIITALNDILNLTEDELKTERYKDYAGKEKQWDLPTLIYKHFVPDRKGKSLGNNFYHDVKKEEVQKSIRHILENLD